MQSFCQESFKMSVVVRISHVGVSLTRWPTTFKQKVIQQSKALPTSSELEELIYCAEAISGEEEMDDTLESGIFTFCTLVFLLLQFLNFLLFQLWLMHNILGFELCIN